jgi:hypothetical protein
MVESLCATAMVVTPPARLLIAYWMAASLSESRADVASSRISSSGLRNRALAIAIRCFCPPDSSPPLTPTTVASSMKSMRASRLTRW